jgi:hypothetical protein
MGKGGGKKGQATAAPARPARPARRDEIDGVVCLWMHDAVMGGGGKPRGPRGPWRLADIFAVNDDGRRLANPSGRGVDEWPHWLRDPEVDGEEGVWKMEDFLIRPYTKTFAHTRF